MRAADVELLMIPGFGGADADHWQTRWQARIRTARTIEQDDWQSLDLDAWAGRVVAAVQAATKPAVLVAHAAGVAVVARAAPKLPQGRVVAAFLVAPLSEQSLAALPGCTPANAEYPIEPLPFPSVLVASRSDPHCPYETAGELALAWGSTLVDAGEVGHVDGASGHGPWPEGVMRLGLLLQQLGPSEAP